MMSCEWAKTRAEMEQTNVTKLQHAGDFARRKRRFDSVCQVAGGNDRLGSLTEVGRRREILRVDDEGTTPVSFPITVRCAWGEFCFKRLIKSAQKNQEGRVGVL